MSTGGCCWTLCSCTAAHGAVAMLIMCSDPAVALDHLPLLINVSVFPHHNLKASETYSLLLVLDLVVGSIQHLPLSRATAARLLVTFMLEAICNLECTGGVQGW